MPTGIGLRGLGRIGRNIFRILYKSDDLRIQAVSDVADPAALAYLLRFDTILGRFPDEVSIKGGHLYVAGRQVKMLTEEKGSETTPPWGELGGEVVIEATSKYRTRAEVERHFAAGATRGILWSPPGASAAVSIVFGGYPHRVPPGHPL